MSLVEKGFPRVHPAALVEGPRGIAPVIDTVCVGA